VLSFELIRFIKKLRLFSKNKTNEQDMSDKPQFSEYDDDPTMMQPGLGVQHASPFQDIEPLHGSGPDLASEKTMVAEGPDLSSEVTMVHQASLSPKAKLHVQEGVNKDKDYIILGEEVSFGREKDNSISHPDLSVSRRHFKIHVKNDKFTLEDLGSSSGTLVNNKKVNGSIRLNHGDKIQVGKTLLVFQMDDAAIPSSPNMALVGGILGGVAVITMAVVFFVFRSPTKPLPVAKADAGQTRVKPPPTRKSAASDYIKQGLALKNQLNYRRAKLLFQQAKKLAPKSFLANVLYKESAAEEKTDFLLRKSTAKLSQGLHDDAYAALKQSASILSPGSVYADKVWKQLIELNAKRKNGTKPPNKPAWFFKHGDWQTAATKYAAFGKDKKAIAVRNFHKAFDAGRTHYQNWKIGAGITELQKARGLDTNLSGSESVFSKQIREMLSNLYCQKGLLLLKKGGDDNLFAAAAQFRRAELVHPKHAETTRQLEALKTKAKVWLEDAKKWKKGKKKAKAKQRLKAILRITSRSDDVYRSAKKLLRSL
jgi:tetratricopeptide (TPR) repeat protein